MGTPANPLEVNPAPAPAPGRKQLVCEFCECRLTPGGEIIEMGDRAKNFRKHTETIETLNAEIARQKQEIGQLEAKVAQLSPQTSHPSPGEKRRGVIASR